MSALHRPGIAMIIGYVFSSILIITLVQGSQRRSCIDKDPPPAEIFTEEHYGEVGFARDACVELGRNLHIRLHLTEETKPCEKLAATRTSTCLPCRGCRKWQREERKNAKANADVMAKALTMVQHFIDVVAVEHKLIDISDEKFIFECINTTIDLLRKSGLTLYSQEDTEKKKLIDEIEKMKPAFCGGYLRQLASEAAKRQADYLEELYKNEFLQTTENLNGETYDGENDAGRVMRREIKISDLNTNEEDEEMKQIKRNRDQTSAQEAGTGENGWEIGTKIEQDTILTGFPDGSINQGEAFGVEETQNIEELPLHESVFRNDYSKMCAVLERGYDVKKKDKHGNTALHLAILLGRREFTKKLVEYGAPIRSRNLMGFRPADEAVSYGDLETGSSIGWTWKFKYGSVKVGMKFGACLFCGCLEIVKFLLMNMPKQVQEELITRRRILLNDLNTIPNFYMELKWEFCFAGFRVRGLFPTDICKIRKRNELIRMDWTLIGVPSPMNYKYGQVAIIFDGAASPSPVVYFMDLKKNAFVKIGLEDTSTPENSGVDFDESAKDLMKTEIVAFTVSTRNAQYEKVMTNNWWYANTVKTETVSSFTATIYKLSGLVAIFSKRNEHLKVAEEEKKRIESESGPRKSSSKRAERNKNEKNKEETENKDKDGQGEEKQPEEEEFIPIPPPPPTGVTWEAYINAPPGRYGTLGRDMFGTRITPKIKDSTLAVVPDFPITKEAFLRILEVIAPFKQFIKLREFMESKMPPGFPVPIILGLSAKITLLKFESSETIAEEPILDENLFKVPEDYQLMKEDEMDSKLKSLMP